MNEIAIIKVIHYIGMILWMAGIFSVVNALRIKENQPALIDSGALHDAMKKSYKMYMNPGMMTVWSAGLVLLYLYGTTWLKVNHWMHLKLLLIVIMTVYHIILKKVVYNKPEYYLSMSAPARKLIKYASYWLVLAIIILAVFKTSLNYVYFGGVILLYVLISWFVYNRKI